MKTKPPQVTIAGNSMRAHLNNAALLLSLKRELGEPLNAAELAALEDFIRNALGCLEIARELGVAV